MNHRQGSATTLLGAVGAPLFSIPIRTKCVGVEGCLTQHHPTALLRFKAQIQGAPAVVELAHHQTHPPKAAIVLLIGRQTVMNLSGHHLVTVVDVAEFGAQAALSPWRGFTGVVAQLLRPFRHLCTAPSLAIAAGAVTVLGAIRRQGARVAVTAAIHVGLLAVAFPIVAGRRRLITAPFTAKATGAVFGDPTLLPNGTIVGAGTPTVDIGLVSIEDLVVAAGAGASPLSTATAQTITIKIAGLTHLAAATVATAIQIGLARAQHAIFTGR